MSINGDMYYFLNWEFLPPSSDLVDATQGNEYLEVYIQDVEGCRPACRYTLPITQAGQSFSLIRANLLYPMDKCTTPLKNIYVSVRIYRGYERKLIYTNDLMLFAPNYGDGRICRVPIYRVWYWQDYLNSIITNIVPF